MAVLPLVGAGVLGVLSEYATYNYAIFYGFRPSFEGVPYLKAAVTFISFAFLFFGAFIFISIVLVIRWYASQAALVTRFGNFMTRKIGASERGRKFLEKYPYVFADARTTLQHLLSKPSWFVKCFSVIFCALSLIIFYFICDANFASESVGFKIRLSILSTILFLALLSSIIWKGLVWLCASLGSVLSVVTALVLMFNPPVYANFLRIVGYGGGMPIKIMSGDENARVVAEGYLLLRTTDSLLIFDEGTRTISEYTKESKMQLSHPAGGLGNLPFSLPN